MPSTGDDVTPPCACSARVDELTERVATLERVAHGICHATTKPYSNVLVRCSKPQDHTDMHRSVDGVFVWLNDVVRRCTTCTVDPTTGKATRCMLFLGHAAEHNDWAFTWRDAP